MTRKTRAVFLTALIALSVLALGVVVTPAAAGGDHVVVHSNSEVGEYSSIQAAVDDAAAGDTIEVKEGTYGEDIVVDQSDIDIVSNERATIQGTVEVASDDVTLEGFEIVGPAADGAVVDISNADNLTVEDNVITADLGNNVLSVGGWTGPPEVGNVTIENNELVGGVGLWPMQDAHVVVRNNAITGANTEGIWIASQRDSLDTVSLTIEDNQIEQADQSGVGAADLKIANEPAELNGNSNSDPANAAGMILGSNGAETVELWSGQTYLEDGTILVSNGDSIQDAVDAATPAVPQIQVETGEYAGFVLDESVDVIGDDATITSSVEVPANDLRVRGLQFPKETYEGDVYSPVLDVTGDDVVVEEIVSSAVVEVNEFVILGDGVELRDNDFEHDADVGAALIKANLAQDGAANDLLIHGNSLTNGSIGLFVGDGDSAEIRENTFDTETPDPVWVGGTGYTDPVESSSVVVSDNEGPQVAEGGLVETDNVPGDIETTHYTYGISDALSYASSGATVSVPNGIYEEHVSVQTPVTLRSETGASNTEVVGRIDVESDNVIVDGFTVRNPGAAPGYGSEIDGIFVGNPNGWDDTDGKVDIRNNVIRDVYGSDKTVEAVHVKHYDAGDPIDGVVIQNNHIENVTQKDAGADGIKLQADVNDVSIGGNEIRDVNGSWAYGIVLTPSSTESGVPSDVGIHLNTLADIDAIDYDGVGVGIDGSQGDYASAAEAGVHQNEFHETMDIAVLNKNPEDSVNAQLNWWGDADGPTDGAAQGPVNAEPFLTTADAVGQGPDTTEFAVSRELGAGVSTLAVPAPTERTVDEMFGGTHGVIWAFEDGEWEQVDGEETLDTMDAVVVTLEGDTRVVVEFEGKTGNEPVSPDAVGLDAGWNFVGAPSRGHAEEVFGASSADPSRLMDLFEGPMDAADLPHHQNPYTFGTNEDGPLVSPYKGYFVYANDDGSVAANGYAGITAEEAFGNGLVP